MFEFIAEAGGIISGEGINGSVQEGNVIFTAGTDEFEGRFISQNTIEAVQKTSAGQTSKCNILMAMK